MEYTKPIMVSLSDLNMSNGIVAAINVHVEFCVETVVYLAVAFAVAIAIAIGVVLVGP